MKRRSAESRAILYAAIERAMAEFPDMRVGQVIVNALPHGSNDPFYIEDDDLAARIDAMCERAKGGGCE